jgi:hypothetical protein
MNKNIEERILRTWERDLMAELSIELYNEGVRSNDIKCVGPAELQVSNCLRDLERCGKIYPMSFRGTKTYSL